MTSEIFDLQEKTVQNAESIAEEIKATRERSETKPRKRRAKSKVDTEQPKVVKRYTKRPAGVDATAWNKALRIAATGGYSKKICLQDDGSLLVVNSDSLVS